MKNTTGFKAFYHSIFYHVAFSLGVLLYDLLSHIIATKEH